MSAPTDPRAVLERAWARRAPHLAACSFDAYRLLNGSGDRAPPGLTLDRYADWLVLSAREQHEPTQLEDWAAAAVEQFQPAGLVLKTLRRDARLSQSQVWAGTLPEAPIRVREGPATLRCRLGEGLGTGLFLDQRETRLQIAGWAGARVLNLFAHTGAFSVHAALAGAMVTSVDTSKRALTWARENMRESGLDPDQHRWFPDDVMSHLARATRRGDRYSLVIVDPPAFGSDRGRTFSLERALEDLLGLATGLIEEGGFGVVATHTRTVGAHLSETIARVAGPRFHCVSSSGLPDWDHPVDPRSAIGADRGDYLRTLVLRAGRA